jgi:hypothetical protein
MAALHGRFWNRTLRPWNGYDLNDNIYNIGLAAKGADQQRVGRYRESQRVCTLQLRRRLTRAWWAGDPRWASTIGTLPSIAQVRAPACMPSNLLWPVHRSRP